MMYLSNRSKLFEKAFTLTCRICLFIGVLQIFSYPKAEVNRLPEGQLFEQALNEMDAKGHTTLSLLFTNYEVHLALTKKADELEFRLSPPTRIAALPDAPRIQNELALWIVEQLRAGLNARNYDLKKYTLTMDGILNKEKLTETISRSMAKGTGTQTPKASREVSYLAALGVGIMSPVASAKPLQITLR